MLFSNLKLYAIGAAIVVAVVGVQQYRYHLLKKENETLIHQHGRVVEQLEQSQYINEDLADIVLLKDKQLKSFEDAVELERKENLRIRQVNELIKRDFNEYVQSKKDLQTWLDLPFPSDSFREWLRQFSTREDLPAD